MCVLLTNPPAKPMALIDSIRSTRPGSTAPSSTSASKAHNDATLLGAQSAQYETHTRKAPLPYTTSANQFISGILVEHLPRQNEEKPMACTVQSSTSLKQVPGCQGNQKPQSLSTHPTLQTALFFSVKTGNLWSHTHASVSHKSPTTWSRQSISHAGQKHPPVLGRRAGQKHKKPRRQHGATSPITGKVPKGPGVPEPTKKGGETKQVTLTPLQTSSDLGTVVNTGTYNKATSTS